MHTVHVIKLVLEWEQDYMHIYPKCMTVQCTVDMCDAHMYAFSVTEITQ